MPHWYETLFSNYARQYDDEVFTRGTIREVDFIEQEIGPDKSQTILDIGCGTGRHSIELARRGYRVTGIDLSANQLARAADKAQVAGVSVRFLQRDARDFDFEVQFDHLIMLCEGSFSLMETDEMNYRILENAVAALKPGGKLIFNALNALFPLHHSTAQFMAENSSETTTSEDHRFDLLTLRDHSKLTFKDDDGVSHTIRCNERYFMPSEISWYLRMLGMGSIDIVGCQTGDFSRSQALTCDHFEMLVIAQK